MDDHTVTTIFFDGQFHIALIEKQINGKTYCGKFTFGSEPTGPEVISFMEDTYAFVPLREVDSPVKIRILKEVNRTHSLKRSLDCYKEAERIHLEEQRRERRKEETLRKNELYLKKKEKSRNRKKH